MSFLLLAAGSPAHSAPSRSAVGKGEERCEMSDRGREVDSSPAFLLVGGQIPVL